MKTQQEKERKANPLKGHGNEPDFPRLLHKSVRHRSLKLHFEPFRFWLRILGDIRIRKSTPRLNDTGSWRLSVSMISGVGDSPTQGYGESTTLRITDTQSRRLPASPTRRVGYWIFKRKLAVSVIRRVVDSAYRWYGESLTPRIGDTESRWLPVSLSRRVADSAYRWYEESPTPRIVESGSRFSNMNISENSKPKSEWLEMQWYEIGDTGSR